MTAGLNNPVQKLHPFVTYNPFVQRALNEQQLQNSRIQKIAVIALAVIAFVFLAIVAPALCGFPLLVFVWPISNYGKNDEHKDAAAFNTKMIEHMNYLDGPEIQKKLNKLGIQPGIEPEKLKSIFARYCVLQEDQLTGYSFDKGAYTVEMAYLLRIMKFPYDPRPVKAFCTRNYEFDYTKNRVKDSFSFGRIKTDTKEYSSYDLNQKDPVELAREIFELQGGAPAQSNKGWFDEFSGIGIG